MLRAILRSALLIALVFGVGAATPPRASAEVIGGEKGSSRDPSWSAHVGGGFSLSPGGGLFATSLEYAPVRELGIGPLLQIAGDDHTLIVAPTANLRYRVDLSHLDDDVLRRFEPYVQGGVGFAYVDKDRGPRDRDDAELMLNGGVGIEYRVSSPLSLGTGILFNGMPVDDAAGERFFFSWQLLSARVHF